MAATVPVFQWNQKYATGILEIDSQHQYLFALTNRIARHAADGVSRITIATTLAQLQDYVRDHFSYEESVLRQVNYPYLKEHIEQHQRLVGQLDNFALRLEKKDLPADDFARFVQKWLSRHILQDDMKYLPAVKKTK